MMSNTLTCSTNYTSGASNQDSHVPVLGLQGIGNGIPIGAVVTTPEIAQVLTRRSYFNTFGGNPVSTAGGHAVLKVLEKEKLQENAFVVGSYLKERLNMLKEKHGSK
jgi:alanine-glyoxylate transaminase / (R)-3-amino-2-methylpropionate-pyruvate transaminase